jgi:hypothetical protein
VVTKAKIYIPARLILGMVAVSAKEQVLAVNSSVDIGMLEDIMRAVPDTDILEVLEMVKDEGSLYESHDLYDRLKLYSGLQMELYLMLHPEWMKAPIEQTFWNDHSIQNVFFQAAAGQALVLRGIYDKVSPKYPSDGAGWQGYRKAAFHDLDAERLASKRGGQQFIDRLTDWISSQDINAAEKIILWYSVMPDMKPDLKLLKSMKAREDWKFLFDNHPQLKGKTLTEIYSDKEGIGALIHGRWNKWVNSQPEDLRDAYRRDIRPYNSTKCFYELEGQVVGFDSMQEGVVGLLLHYLDIIPKFKSGENLHVYTEKGKSRKSIDFKVGDIYIEYHPLSYADIEAGRDTLQKVIDYKSGPIKYLLENGAHYIHVASIEEFYDKVVMDSRMQEMFPGLKNLTREQYSIELSSVYAQIGQKAKSVPQAAVA